MIFVMIKVDHIRFHPKSIDGLFSHYEIDCFHHNYSIDWVIQMSWDVYTLRFVFR